MVALYALLVGLLALYIWAIHVVRKRLDRGHGK